MHSRKDVVEHGCAERPSTDNVCVLKGLRQMNVKIKKFDVNVDVKTKGIEFEVRTPDGKAQLGDCRLTMTGLTWCPGKTSKKNGIMVKWPEFIDLLSSRDSLKRAVKAAKNPPQN